LVTIELTNGDVYAYTLGTGGLTFEANKQYTINLRVGKDQVDLSGVTVGDWGGTVDLGDADSEIYFEDPLFVSRLIKDYNIPHTNGFIDPTDPATKAAIETITELDVSNPWDAGDDVKIKSLKGIEYFVNLTSLDCYNNQLTSLEVSNLTNLTSLFCRSNQLSSLKLTNLTELLALYCENNQLTSLDVKNLINLTYLYCRSNQLSSLDVGNLTNLTSLSCYSNQLMSLDVKNLTNLTSLSCSNNQLSSLDVGNLTNLTELRCESNQLSSLDVENLTELTYLYCYNNQLTSLNISSIIALKNFSCKNQKDANGVSRVLELTLTEVQRDALSSAITSGVNPIIVAAPGN
ncbi:MAG: leucine-rich repeat domain-containing protein, partial [Bacteroidales bacterium]